MARIHEVAFTNSTVFILDFHLYMTKPVWAHVLAFSAWTLNKTHVARKPDYKYPASSRIWWPGGGRSD